MEHLSNKGKVQLNIHCEDHGDEDFQYAKKYCKSCDLLLCIDCVLDKHDDHIKETKFTLEDYLNMKSQELKQVENQISFNKQTTPNDHQYKESVINYVAETVKAKQDFFSQIITLLNNSVVKLDSIAKSTKEAVNSVGGDAYRKL